MSDDDRRAREVAERCDVLLAEHDPATTDPIEFLGAQFDLGLAWVHFPEGRGGLGLSPKLQTTINQRLGSAGAPAPYARNPIGYGMCAPTVVTHGSEAQKQRYLRPLFTGEEVWCQMFSEPGAGSDVAGLSTRAVDDGDEWVLNGQKVWTTLAHVARFGIVIARTDPEQVKHKGLTMFVIDMHAPGVEVRPLVQITGEAEFNEVFMDEVFVPREHLVGELHNGWAVANTTLAHERGTSFPFKEQVVHEVFLDELYAIAAARGALDDVEIADSLAQSFVELRVLRLHNWRTLSRLSKGIQPGPESSYVKLQWTDMTQHMADVALGIEGADAPRYPGKWQRQWLWSKAASVAGGTSEVQRTIIGDRILGLPR